MKCKLTDQAWNLVSTLGRGSAYDIYGNSILLFLESISAQNTDEIVNKILSLIMLLSDATFYINIEQRTSMATSENYNR